MAVTGPFLTSNGVKKTSSGRILETKGYHELEQVKAQAAKRWVDAVNADGSYGMWKYEIARKPEEVSKKIDAAAGEEGD